MDSNDENSAVGLKPQSIPLKLSKVYDPEKHCIRCLEGGSAFNPLLKLSSNENGRSKIIQVTYIVFVYSR